MKIDIISIDEDIVVVNKPAGVSAVHDPNRSETDDMHTAVTGALGKVWLVHRLDRDPTHLHKVGRADWVEWAQRRFQVLEWGGAFRFLFPGGVYLHWPTRLMRSATPCIAVVARKPFK